VYHSGGNTATLKTWRQAITPDIYRFSNGNGTFIEENL
jgi:hypothetical protein